MSQRRITALICALAAVLAVLTPCTRRTAAADDATPSIVPASAEPTLSPTALVVPTTVPTVRIRAERTPTPPVSLLPTPTLPPLGTATSVVVVQPTPNLPSSTSLLPSPDDLRTSARLRWGKHVPRAVRRWAYLIVPAGKRYGVDPNLIAAVMTTESGGDPMAWSGSDARGLMQVLHGPFDPAENIDIGTRMLSGFLQEFHSIPLALAAYNAGPGAVLQFGGIPPYRETRDYVIIVTYLYDVFGHHPLTARRKAQYRKTVRDILRVPALKKKLHVPTGAVDDSSDSRNPCRAISTCNSAPAPPPALFPTMDPFWPMPGPPDPLQHVGPDFGGP